MQVNSYSKSNSIFVSFVLALAALWVYVYGVVQMKYAPKAADFHGLEVLAKKIAQEQIKTKVAEERLLDLQVELVSHGGKLPNSLLAEFKNLRNPASIKNYDLSGLQFVEAKKSFNAKDYLRSRRQLDKLLVEFPTSPYALEARFLIAESYFRNGQIQEALSAVDEMVVQYPDAKLTGFLLLRMAGIFKKQHELEKSHEILDIIKKNFSAENDLQAAAAEVLGDVQQRAQ